MNEDLEKIIENCLKKIEKKISTPEECLEAYPQYREELKPILFSAQMVKEVSPSTPPEFKVALREKLLTKAAEKIGKKKPTLFRLPRRKALALLLAATLILSLVGIGYAASRETDPNSPLYPVKIALEKVKLVFAREPSQKIKLHLENANRRLQELKNLKEKGSELQSKKLEFQSKKLSDALNEEINEAKKLLNSLNPTERKQVEESIQQVIEEEKTLRGLPSQPLQQTPSKERGEKDTGEKSKEGSEEFEKGGRESERESEREKENKNISPETHEEAPFQKDMPETQH
jgi:Skp family chaperone for outer membrane proteins